MARANDSTGLWYVVSFYVSMAGVGYGLLLGRAPRRFVILFLLTFPILFILLRFPRPLSGPNPFVPPPDFDAGTAVHE
jgi:hypothetical protein